MGFTCVEAHPKCKRFEKLYFNAREGCFASFEGEGYVLGMCVAKCQAVCILQSRAATILGFI